jgi:hypothetical protein
LSKLDVSKFTERKDGLTYLSWTYAWAYILEHFPNATYDIIKNEDELPYFIDDTGSMVYTSVTIEGITRHMWLSILDGANKSLKKEDYTYKAKYGDKLVSALTMFDVNKALMRCLVKNLAMFGLGINVYAGEDLPLDLTSETLEIPATPVTPVTPVAPTKKETSPIKKKVKVTESVVKEIKDLFAIKKISEDIQKKQLTTKYGVEKIEDLSLEDANAIISKLK